jgi:hypothetical protein
MSAKAGFVPRLCHHDTRGAPSIFPAQKQEQSRISPSDTVVVLTGPAQTGRRQIHAFMKVVLIDR